MYCWLWWPAVPPSDNTIHSSLNQSQLHPRYPPPPHRPAWWISCPGLDHRLRAAPKDYRRGVCQGRWRGRWGGCIFIFINLIFVTGKTDKRILFNIIFSAGYLWYKARWLQCMGPLCHLAWIYLPGWCVKHSSHIVNIRGPESYMYFISYKWNGWVEPSWIEYNFFNCILLFS